MVNRRISEHVVDVLGYCEFWRKVRCDARRESADAGGDFGREFIDGRKHVSY